MTEEKRQAYLNLIKLGMKHGEVCICLGIDPSEVIQEQSKGAFDFLKETIFNEKRQ